MNKGPSTLLALSLLSVPAVLWASSPASQDTTKPTKLIAPGTAASVASPLTPTAPAKAAPVTNAAPAIFSQDIFNKLTTTPFKEEAAAPAGAPQCPTFKKKPAFLKRAKAEGAKTSYEPVGTSWTSAKQGAWYVIDQSATQASDLLDKKAPKKPYFSTEKVSLVSTSVTQGDGKPFIGCKYIITNKKDVGRQKQMVFILYPVK